MLSSNRNKKKHAIMKYIRLIPHLLISNKNREENIKYKMFLDGFRIDNSTKTSSMKSLSAFHTITNKGFRT